MRGSGRGSAVAATIALLLLLAPQARATPPARVAAHLAPPPPPSHGVPPPTLHPSGPHAATVPTIEQSSGPGAHLFDAIRLHQPRVQLLRAAASDTRATEGFASFAEKRYGAAGAPALATLRAAAAQFEELIVDPGTVLHVDTFRAFVDARPELKKGDAWAARQAFSEALGTRTVYRALALTPEGFAKLHTELPENGIGSRLLRMPGQASAERTRTETLQTQVDDHVDGKAHHGEPIVSVSEKPRVAASVAGAIARAGDPGKGYGVYLFTLQVPAIDLMAERPGSAVLEQPGTRRPLVIAWKDAAGRDHATTQPFPTPKVESFVLYGLDGSEVTKVQQVSLERAGKFSFPPIAASP